MLYFIKISESGNSAVYNFGMDMTNLTGTIRFYRDGSFEIIGYPCCTRIKTEWIYEVVSKEKENFSQGIFEDKIY